MSKLLRFTQKLFGSTAGSNQMSKYGSLASGTPVRYSGTTITPALVQELPNYLEGWYAGILGSNSPAIEDMNSLFYLCMYQLCYTMQSGIPEWDSGTTYYIGSIVNNSGTPYVSLTNDNLNNLVSDPTKWIIFADKIATDMTATGANTVASTMTSTGANTIATKMTSTGANTIASTMNSTGANTIATTMNSTGANAIATTMSNPNITGLATKTSSKNVIVSSFNATTNSLAIIRGSVSSAGSPIGSEGYTSSRLSPGTYQITYVNAFADTPVTVATITAPLTAATSIMIVSQSTTSAIVQTTDSQPVVVDATFSFMIIGQRTV